MKKFRNRAMALIVSAAMIMTCFAAFTVTSFADDSAAIKMIVVEQDGTENEVASFTAEELEAKAGQEVYPYFYSGKSGPVVLAAKGALVADLISEAGLDMSGISGVKVCSGDFAPNNNQKDYLDGGGTYVNAALDEEGNVVIDDETTTEVPFMIATETYSNSENGITFGGETDTVQKVFDALKVMIDAGTAVSETNRAVMGSLNKEDIAGNKFVKSPDTIRFYKGSAQELTVKASGKTLKAKKVRKADQLVKTPVKVSGASEGSEVSFTKVKVNKKAGKFAVDEETGSITVKKGTKKGKYTVTVKVKSSATLTSFSAEKNAKVVIKIK